MGLRPNNSTQALRAHPNLEDYGKKCQQEIDLKNFPSAFLSHLAVYVAAQKVLQRADADYKLQLRSSQDGPFLTAARLGWDADVLADHLAAQPTPPRVDLIELTGAMRKAM